MASRRPLDSQEVSHWHLELALASSSFPYQRASVLDGDLLHACKIFRNREQENQKTNAGAAFGRQPAIGALAKERALIDRVPARNGKRSRAELKAAAKGFSLPRSAQALLAFLPIAHPRKVLAAENIDNQ